MLTEPGDVVVPVLGGGSVARVIDDATGGAALGRNLCCCAPIPPRSTPGSSPASCAAPPTTGRPAATRPRPPASMCADSNCPGSPLDEQRRYGEHFRALDDFEEALRQAGRLGDQLVRGMYDGLTDGTVRPSRQIEVISATTVRYNPGPVVLVGLYARTRTHVRAPSGLQEQPCTATATPRPRRVTLDRDAGRAARDLRRCRS